MQPAPARVHLQAAHAHRQQHGEHYYAAELCRLQAWVLALEGAPSEQVRKYLGEAVDIARTQHAGLLERRAAKALAEL